MNGIVRFSLIIAALTILSLPACGQGPEATLLGPDSLVAGTITDWKNGTGYTINAYMWKPDQKDGTLVASSPVSVQGEFAFQLPPEDEVKPFLRYDYLHVTDTACSQVPTFAPADLRFAPVGIRIEKKGLPALRLVFRDYADIGAAPPDYTNGDFVFSEAAGQISGQIACPGGIIPGTYDIHLVRGWNLIFDHISHSSGTPKVTAFKVSSDPSPGGCKWYAQ